MGGGNDFKTGSGGGKRSFSNLAGGNKAHKLFGSIPTGKRPLSTMSALVGCHKVKGNNMLRGYGAYQLPTGPAVFRHFPRMAKSAEVIATPWARLLAQLPRKY
jgi:hypothetical protein